MSDVSSLEKPRANRRRNAILMSKIICCMLATVFSVVFLVDMIQKSKTKVAMANRSPNRALNLAFKQENEFVLLKGDPPQLTINNMVRITEKRRKNGTVLTICNANNEEKPKIDIEILNGKFFNLDKLLSFLKRRHPSQGPEIKPIDEQIGDCIFDTETSYFGYFREYSNELNYNGRNKPVNIFEKIDFGAIDPSSLLGQNKAKVMDVRGDGYCFYYALLFNIYDALKDPESKIFKRVFKLENSQSKQYLLQIKGFDEIRVNLLLYILSSNDFFELSKHQLFDFVYYLRILIFAEVSQNKEKYEEFIRDKEIKYTEICLFSYYEMNQNVEPVIISNLLNYGITVIGVEYGDKKVKNPRIALNTTEDQHDGVLCLLLIANSHYNAIFF